MNCLQSWCPGCVSNCIRIGCVYFSKKMGNKKKSYQGINELEEQQFKFRDKQRVQKKRIFNQNITSSDIRNKIEQPSKISLSDSIENGSLNQQMDVNLALEKQQRSNQQRNNQQMSLLEQQNHNAIDLRAIQTDHSNFKINIDPFNKYYEIITVKTKNLHELFNAKGEQMKIGGESACNFYAQQVESNQGQIFIFTYELPCSYSFYSNLNNNHSEGIFKAFNSVIEEYSLLQSIQNNLKVNFLSFNKFMILQPRQFTYIKYSYGINNQQWEICCTLEDQDQYKNQKPKILQGGKRITGDFFTATYIREQIEQGKPKINIKTYCWIDVKSSIKTVKFFSRGLLQVKNYLDRLTEHCKSSFQQELA